MSKAAEKNSRSLLIFIGVVIGISFLGLLIYNCAVSWREFFKIPVYHWLNLIIAIYIAFYLVQKKNDERKLKDMVIDLLDKIQLELSTEDAHTFNEGYDRNTAYMKQRKISNKLTLLDQLKDKLNFENELEAISKNFNEYRTMFGDYMEDAGMLSSHQREFQRIVNIIDHKCDEIKVKIFK